MELSRSRRKSIGGNGNSDAYVSIYHVTYKLRMDFGLLYSADLSFCARENMHCKFLCIIHVPQ